VGTTQATVMLMTFDRTAGGFKRDYFLLKLERQKVLFLPLTWTIVHPIEDDSPLRGKTQADLHELQAEVIIMVKAWDETFSQTVHQRFSYHYGEIVWNARFAPAFAVNEEGDMVLDVNRVGAFVEINGSAGTATPLSAYSGQLSVSAVPEAGTYLLLLAGLGMVCLAARYRKIA